MLDLEPIDDAIEDNFEDEFKKEQAFADKIINSIAFTFTIPATLIYLGKLMSWGIHFDAAWKNITCFILLFLFCSYQIHRFLNSIRGLVIIGFLVAAGILLFNTIQGSGYGFDDLKVDFHHILEKLVLNVKKYNN